ncbi:MAG: glycoside hydrolase family 3 N-terminal domain-containing protein [Paracoccaceae bacterium]|nr:glycoside hydrolase family 3 protein [Paracoccaceae bacterium]MDG2374508.1 glycoside hydrolase family 3 N-terminal domain-containing protein [Paracoccaceae bacterium]
MTVGAYIFGCIGSKLSKKEFDFFKESQPWGFILFSRNIESKAQVKLLTMELRESVGRNAPILIDQEGGRVQRMRSPEWMEYLPALTQVKKSGSHAGRVMYLRSRLIALELNEIGIDVNCAPVADLLKPNTHTILADRCYGETVEDVVKISRAVATGLLDGGVLPVVKHIPGYGRAVVDGHEQLPIVRETLEVLTRTDFLPFKLLADLPISMTAHITYTSIDDTPATISKKMLSLIRNDLGYKNLIITDDISMGALEGSIFERSKSSIDAGCDIVLHCNGDLKEMIDVANASGQLTSQGEERSQFALEQKRPPKEESIDELQYELSKLMPGEN